ncbi:MAG: 30S ribosomal protein S17 [Pseudomonadota bacterium]
MERKVNKKTLVGRVKSNKMDKTVVVTVKRKVKHAQFKKYITTNSTYKAHDEKNECSIGDKVTIVETRPLSKDKRWRVSEIIEKTTIIN